MNNFRMLLQRNFWIKVGVISWWGTVVGSYVWFLGFVGKLPVLDGWLSVVAATLIGGAGMNHISNLYRTPMNEFELDYVWPVLFISFGAILLVAGVLLGSIQKELWAQILSILYVFIAVVTIALGSDTAPRNENA